ncbi:MAG: hypothetical protein IT313_09890 [Anaerolineales bacterium]|nr:hypothetical protein [Anaerolineales bacterium]
MKTQTFVRLSLLFPYALWVVLASFMVVMSKIFPASESLPIFSALLTISFIYAFGILVWGIPYSILALGLWIWSAKKDANTMKKVFIFSPLMLAILVAIEALFILGRDHGVPSDFGEAVLALGGLSILFGYGTIGMVAGLYKLLRMGNFIEQEDETTSTQLETF